MNCWFGLKELLSILSFSTKRNVSDTFQCWNGSQLNMNSFVKSAIKALFSQTSTAQSPRPRDSNFNSRRKEVGRIRTHWSVAWQKSESNSIPVVFISAALKLLSITHVFRDFLLLQIIPLTFLITTPQISHKSRRSHRKSIPRNQVREIDLWKEMKIRSSEDGDQAQKRDGRWERGSESEEQLWNYQRDN